MFHVVLRVGIVVLCCSVGVLCVELGWQVVSVVLYCIVSCVLYCMLQRVVLSADWYSDKWRCVNVIYRRPQQATNKVRGCYCQLVQN